LILSLAAVLVTASSGVLAQGAPATSNLARDLAATCANCHGTNGKPAPGSAVSTLAGRPKEELARLMVDLRDGKRQATIMHQLGKGFTPEQIDLMAAWFAAQK
jgi:cytochrome c553